MRVGTGRGLRNVGENKDGNLQEYVLWLPCVWGSEVVEWQKWNNL